MKESILPIKLLYLCYACTSHIIIFLINYFLKWWAMVNFGGFFSSKTDWRFCGWCMYREKTFCNLENSITNRLVVYDQFFFFSFFSLRFLKIWQSVWQFTVGLVIFTYGLTVFWGLGGFQRFWWFWWPIRLFWAVWNHKKKTDYPDCGFLKINFLFF